MRHDSTLHAVVVARQGGDELSVVFIENARAEPAKSEGLREQGQEKLMEKGKETMMEQGAGDSLFCVAVCCVQGDEFLKGFGCQETSRKAQFFV